jgi:ABC-type uncharacterized transport system permease subunit
VAWLRVDVLGIAFGVVLSTRVAQGLLVLGGSPDAPEFAGLREADRVLPFALGACALAWLATWLPVVVPRRRVQVLEWTARALVATGAAWLVWVLLAR